VGDLRDNVTNRGSSPKAATGELARSTELTGAGWLTRRLRQAFSILQPSWNASSPINRPLLALLHGGTALAVLVAGSAA